MPETSSTRISALVRAAALALTLGLGLHLFWPSLRLGLFADDYVALAMLDGKFAAPRAGLDLFDFANGKANDITALRRLGSTPWWAPDDFRVSFLRPLSSALWHVDRALFGEAYWEYHAHSLFAWALLVVAAAACYRLLLPPWVAAFATLAFGLDESHHFAVLWLSNRGGIYAVAFGLLGLLAHLRFREGGARAYALLSAVAFSVALGLGEWALPAFAYVFAYELLATRDSLRTRALSLLPAGLPALAFLALRAALGYGARGSGEYVDPAAEPLHFGLALVQRLPVFVADMLTNMPSVWWDAGTPWRERVLEWAVIPPSIWMRLPSWRVLHYALGLAACGLLALALRWCWPGLSSAERERARFLALGALLALVPVVGSFPSTRLTMAAFFGVAPLVALVLRQIARSLATAPRISLPKFLALYGLGMLIVYLQVLSPLGENIEAQANDFATSGEWVAGAELDPNTIERQRVFLLGSAEFTTTFYFAYIWAAHGFPLPQSYAPITTAPFALALERPAADELRISTLGGSFLSSGFESMFRPIGRPMAQGETVALPGMQLQAEHVVAGAPDTLRLRFERPLDDPAYVFLTATQEGLVRVELPKLGEQRIVPRAAFPNWLSMERKRYERRLAPIPEAMLSYASPPGFVVYEP